MTLSAVHRPLNPPFRRAPGASVRPRLLAFLSAGRFLRRFLPTKKRQRTPVADCDQYFLRKKGTKHPRHRHGFLATFDTKKYKVPRGRRPRLTADQKAANNISRRLRSVLFATQQHLEIPATGSGARASVSAKSVAIFRSGTRFATFGLVVPGKIVTFESYLFKPIERCSNACSRLRPSSIKRG